MHGADNYERLTAIGWSVPQRIISQLSCNCFHDNFLVNS